MRKLCSIISLAAALAVFTSPSMAQQRASSEGGVVLATLGGVVVGGALVYYYYPLSQLTTTALGAIVGGSIGNWWYGVADSGEGYQAAQPRKQSGTESPIKPFQLISYSEGRRPALRTAD